MVLENFNKFIEFRALNKNKSNLQDGKPVSMQRSLFSTSMNVVTRLLFRKRYFSTEHTNEDYEEFKDLNVKIMTLCGTFNISDYVPYLKPFDVQGLVPQFNQTRLRFDRLFDRIIQAHLKETKRPDESKDFLDVMLSLPGVDGVIDRIDDSTIRAVVNVSCSILSIIQSNEFVKFGFNLFSGCAE
jgi:hypothetical protein